MTVTKYLLTTTLCLMLGTSAFAQTTTPQAPADGAASATDGAAAPAENGAGVPNDLSMGADADAGDPNAIGATYVAGKEGDWEQRCVRTEDGADPCQMYQLLLDADGNPVAEISIFGLPKGQQAVAGATIIVPLETLLTEDLVMKVDAGKERRYPFSWCSGIGCVARVGFTAAEVDAMRKGNKAEITIVPFVSPDQKVKVNVSLTGFTASLDAVNKANGN